MENSLPLGVGDKQPRWRLLKKHSWRVVGRIPVFPPKHAVGQAWNADNVFPATSTGICLSFDKIGGN